MVGNLDQRDIKLRQSICCLDTVCRWIARLEVDAVRDNGCSKESANTMTIVDEVCREN